ncbi:hypothetical protein LJR267_010702 [Paraburkholderia hospita]|uniref:hypothetical protein n=1 Tax=Paraburkholderia hospita TaxID=169430 RepID=UPI003ECC45D5
MNAGTSNMNMKPAQAGGCGCACGGQCNCEARCCELECLVRPNFFCGQMLTDADLAAMVEWTRSRLALARYRDGWGIVCGLDLSCSAPVGAGSCCGETATGSGPVVYLNAGYALDCCGNDLVVCEPIKVDLGPVCRPPADPCDPGAKPATTPRATHVPQTDGDTQADCLRLKAEDLFAVRLSLRYHEELAQGQRAMFRGACSDDGPCQYARVLERPCVHLEEVPLGAAQNGRNDKESRTTSFQQRLAREVAAIRAVVPKGMDAILQHIRHNPPYQFCFLEEMVCCLRRNEAADRPTSFQDLLHIGKLLLTDWLLRELQCTCSSCLPDDGVPLGRVILRRSAVAGRTQCSVVMIEQSAAYRRPLRKDPCRPLAAGELDLAPYLWQPATSEQEVMVTLVKAKVASEDELLNRLESFANTVVTFDPKAKDQLVAHLADDIVGTSRIAFFVRENAPS